MSVKLDPQQELFREMFLQTFPTVGVSRRAPNSEAVCNCPSLTRMWCDHVLLCVFFGSLLLCIVRPHLIEEASETKSGVRCR